jgi:hypothetical protein
MCHQLTQPSIRRSIAAKYQHENAAGNGLDCLQLASRNPGHASYKLEPKRKNEKQGFSRTGTPTTGTLQPIQTHKGS